MCSYLVFCSGVIWVVSPELRNNNKQNKIKQNIGEILVYRKDLSKTQTLILQLATVKTFRTETSKYLFYFKKEAPRSLSREYLNIYIYSWRVFFSLFSPCWNYEKHSKSPNCNAWFCIEEAKQGWILLKNKQANKNSNNKTPLKLITLWKRKEWKVLHHPHEYLSFVYPHEVSIHCPFICSLGLQLKNKIF